MKKWKKGKQEENQKARIYQWCKLETTIWPKNRETNTSRQPVSS